MSFGSSSLDEGSNLGSVEKVEKVSIQKRHFEAINT